MSAEMHTIFSQLSDPELKEFIANSNDYSGLNGILKRTPDGHIKTLQHTLVPSPFSRQRFHEAVDLQCAFNRLFHAISLDHEFLETTFKPVLSQDDYVRHVWEIYSVEHEVGRVQTLKLALNRSDYMLHSGLPGSPLKQVEINLMASSFGGISERLWLLHQLRLKQLLGDKAPELPPCPSATGFGEAIARTVKEYVKSTPGGLGRGMPAVLEVVSEVETNVFDQRGIEEAVLRADPTIPILRRTFRQLAESEGRATIDADTQRLCVDGVEIALIYFRTGYTPDHFDDETWQTKFRLERSLAVKCPAIDYLLANMKLVQTALTEPSILARFETNPHIASRLAATFARQTVLTPDFGLASQEAIDALVGECRRCPESFVLKPQREGGGNNFFGDEIIRKLDEIMGKPAASAYILMEKLEPTVTENCVVGVDYPAPLVRKMVSELGIYGGLLSRGHEVIGNFESGHLLRTKFVGVNEGGVATGFSFLDTPLLV